ncbi:MAG: RDD family protein [Gammaproteobacteria bacterium]|nr:RDD family protein [Gammaproteobacteria bacterium]
MTLDDQIHEVVAVEFATLGMRLEALGIDLIITAILFGVIAVAIFALNLALPSWFYPLLFLLVIEILFSWQCRTPQQGTLGMRQYGLRLLDLKGETPSLAMMLWRTALMLVSFATVIYIPKGFAHIYVPGEVIPIVIAVIGVILVLVPFYTPRKQALHDLLTGTVVVRSPQPLASEQRVVIEKQEWSYHRFSPLRLMRDLVLVMTLLIGLFLLLSYVNNLIVTGRQ